MKDVEIYASGACYCSVCTSLADINEIIKKVNKLNPTGLKLGWELSKEKTFRQGQSNPCQCEKHPNRKHYLFNC
jgi:hypothetical protein